MRIVVATQRLIAADEHGELREGLDRRWAPFLRECGLTLFPVPNDPDSSAALAARIDPAGILLTGGGDLLAYGGADPVRERTEEALISKAELAGWPVIGVCRGMQFLLGRTGIELREVPGHTGLRHRLAPSGREVNSAHRLSATQLNSAWEATAMCGPVVEAVRHVDRPWLGLMWHPERETPFNSEDIQLFRSWFGGSR